MFGGKKAAAGGSGVHLNYSVDYIGPIEYSLYTKYSANGYTFGPQSIFFNEDGTALYISHTYKTYDNSLAPVKTLLRRHSLSEPFDLTTYYSLTDVYDSGNEPTNDSHRFEGIHFSTNGTKAYAHEKDTDNLIDSHRQWSLSTPYDFSTRVLDGVIDPEFTSTGCRVWGNGSIVTTKELYAGNYYVSFKNLTTPGDLVGLSASNLTRSVHLGNDNYSFGFSGDGKHFYWYDGYSFQHQEYQGGFDLSSPTTTFNSSMSVPQLRELYGFNNYVYAPRWGFHIYVNTTGSKIIWHAYQNDNANTYLYQRPLL